jgi:hypothetical protein
MIGATVLLAVGLVANQHPMSSTAFNLGSIQIEGKSKKSVKVAGVEKSETGALKLFDESSKLYQYTEWQFLDTEEYDHNTGLISFLHLNRALCIGRL